MGKVFTITPGLENMGALKTGGQGSVYKGRRVGEIITAVKLLPTPIHSETSDDKHFTAFQNEVNKLKKVNQQPNPNVVRILSSGLTESGSFPYIEMEFVEGPDLEELLRPPHEPVFTIKEVIRVAEHLSNALAHCHQVGVKHGDVKSNNVKYNVHTGNYVLLDFGMAVLSEEQRRTSLRHAGAIEFMAPEQAEGHVYFETDVYSFGVVLFELLAGSVPFPLKDGAHVSRHQVMIAHMENPPPDLLALRRSSLPSGWSEEKKRSEMEVPPWLVDIIYTCLQKKKESRYPHGMALQQQILSRNSQVRGDQRPAPPDPRLAQLEQRAALLERENERLGRELAVALNRQREPSFVQAGATQVKRRKGSPLLPLLVLFAVLAGGFLVYQQFFGKKAGSSTVKKSLPESANRNIGQFKVLAERAYFYNEPDEATRRNAFMVPSNDVVQGMKEEAGFIYTEFTNSSGQTSKGWLKRSDLLTMEEWRARSRVAKDKELTPAEISSQLASARKLLDEGQVEEALFIYQYLAEKKVPEAMYETGQLGLQRINTSIDCGKAYDLIKEASDREHPPAMRTLGFLYLFADNPEMLQIHNYGQCAYERNVYKGSRLMVGAMLAGDTTARRLVEELEINPATITEGQ